MLKEMQDKLAKISARVKANATDFTDQDIRDLIDIIDMIDGNSTAMFRILVDYIKANGPITVPAYMSQEARSAVYNPKEMITALVNEDGTTRTVTVGVLADE